MPPPKSSASSGTRKKHARKAAGPVVEVDVPREKKGKKHRSDPPRPKVFVAPVKPSAAQPDPLETTGLAHRLPPALLVVLRSLSKKAPVTKIRALEELQTGWVDHCGDEDETALYTVLDMLPVWLHHLPAHLVHPSRRIRLLTATIHAALLRVPVFLDPLTEYASENASGTWALAAHDVDRSVAAVASASRAPFNPDALLPFLEHTLMQPDLLYLELNPLPPVAPPPPPSSKRPTGVVEAPPPRSRTDELDESEPDRRARLRIAAFGALKYVLETTTIPPPPFLESAVLWSALHHAPAPSFLPSRSEANDEVQDEDAPGFGFAQPALRKAAWATLPALLAHRPLPPALVETLAAAVLLSAWVEPDVGTYPTAWSQTPTAYGEFRTTFLSRACGGAPAQYPSVVVVLSTIPSEILAPVHTLFAAFWAAVASSTAPTPFTSALAHERARAGAAFLSALLEHTRVRKKLRKKQRIVANETDLVFSGKGSTAAGRDTPRGGAAEEGGGWCRGELEMIYLMWAWTRSQLPGDAGLVCAVLSVLVGGDGEASADGEVQTVEERVSARGQQLLADVLGAAVHAEDASFIVRALNTFGERIFEQAAFAKALDGLLARRAYALLLTAPALLFAYLEYRASHRQTLYRALLDEIAQHPESAPDALSSLVAPAATRALAGLAGPLDSLFTSHDAPVSIPVLAQVLQRVDLFLSHAAWAAALHRIVGVFAARVEAALMRESEARLSLGAFDGDLELLGAVLAGRPEAAEAEAGVLFPAVYVFGYVLPRAYSLEEQEGGCGGGGAEYVAAVVGGRRWRERGGAGRGEAPDHVLGALAEGTLGVPIDVVADVFPTKEQLGRHARCTPCGSARRQPCSAAPAPSTRVCHLVTAVSIGARRTRIRRALVDDRRSAKENVWVLRHILALALYAEDLLAVPAAASPVFDSSSSALDLGGLAELGKRAQQVATYLLTASVEDGWRERVLVAATDDKPLVGGGALPSLLLDLIKFARRRDGSRDCRVLGRVLRNVLHDADKAEADLWMLFAKKIEKTAPETCIVILSAISDSTLEPPRLERYRNELAADLLGVPASKANSQGLLTLRKLAASAPDVDSDVAFLPQQRSVNIFKACQQWVASDEDLDEEVESAMTLVFFYLAPLLQNVPGTHWDLIYDVLESNLENSMLTDDATLVALARTLRLIILIQDLSSTNKTLRASWEERQMEILKLVRDLAAGQLDGVASSSPRSTCRELVLSIVQDLPTSLISEDTLPKMCHLLADPSVDVQKMTYQLLHVASRKRTEHFVIEAGVDVEAVVKADLPLELLDILQTSLNFGQGDILDLDESTVFGYLLGWMVVFDLFIDASLKVRLSYIDQLRTLDIIGKSFIPNLLSLLGVDQGIPKAFKLDVWAIDEYYVQLYEPGSAWSFQVLAAHLYYRALLTVPSLIYNWVLDCKDRQLSSSIATYTSLHFSPVIIRAELAHVKSPDVTAELVDENLTIKVATAVNEVVVSYLVDEHQLEIKLKIPSDWPLHKIEVKDVQRVGVEETRWRAWILAVQQTLWSQNGRIVDGIGLFKKNVTLHFEGQVECAICYSLFVQVLKRNRSGSAQATLRVAPYAARI
ncbi:hypothetical protein C8J57DRAFT_1239861 [Mycena rebaudengoi]|nr:hypothetical protein C8J57DRAFT_1239861 [Mycena rebaudengoi]